MGRNPDLALLAAAEPYTTGFDKGEERANKESGWRLDEICERALERGKISEKADYGTAIHAVTEPGNDGDVSWHEKAEADRVSFWEKLKEIGAVIIGTEIFTANDDHFVAGTFDHLMYVPGYGIVITDKKTSSEVHGEDFRIQLSVYANADCYDPYTDERMTLEEFVASQGWDPTLLNRKDGLIFWIKNGKTEVYRLDLVKGYEAAGHSTWVRDNHRKGTHKWKAEKTITAALEVSRMELLTEINGAKSVDRLTELWNDPQARAAWGPEHTEAAKARKAALAEEAA